MNNNIDFSVIIPHANSLRFLPKLFSSIPRSKNIEILLIDNSPTQIKKEEIQTDRSFILLYSDSSRGAGGARNVGIDNAQGKWLIFADADDFFTPDAFDQFYFQKDNDADVVYYGMGGIYEDTGEISNRGDNYTRLVKRYLSHELSEQELRACFVSPCSKMVRRSFVNENNIRYHEVVASNDIFFNTVIGVLAKRICAVDKIVYIATVSRGSLTRRRDYAVVSARFLEYLKRNKFLRDYGLDQYQASIMYQFVESVKRKPSKLFYLLYLMIYYQQNPFVGFRNWWKTIIKVRDINKKEHKYITK